MGWTAAVYSLRFARATVVAGLLALCACGPAALARAASATPPPGNFSVALEQCVSASVQSERSATFVAQMVGTPATTKMAMKIQLEQRARGEAEYHVVSAPGLGAWRASEAGVKIYKYVKQVTNLSAPAVYRALVRFRWIGDKGKVIRHAELRSSRCFQPPLTPPLEPVTAVG